jgi:hypothetical protein
VDRTFDRVGRRRCCATDQQENDWPMARRTQHKRHNRYADLGHPCPPCARHKSPSVQALLRVFARQSTRWQRETSPGQVWISPIEVIAP